MNSIGQIIYKNIELTFFLAWFVWTLWFNVRYNKLIKELASQVDPKGEFIEEAGGPLFNGFVVNRDEPRATPEFLNRWNKVHGKFWRLFPFYSVCWLFGGGFALLLIRTVLRS